MKWSLTGFKFRGLRVEGTKRFLRLLEGECAILAFVIIAIIFVSRWLLAQQPAPSLPQRDQYSIADLRDLVAACYIDLDSERKYEAKLVARIRQLEAALAETKTK